MFTNEVPRVGVDVAERLAALRAEMEADGDKLMLVEVPAALLLADVCDLFGLTDAERERVLGLEGVSFVDGVKDTKIRIMNGRQFAGGNRKDRPFSSK